jgi:hypothetical protein
VSPVPPDQRLHDPLDAPHQKSSDSGRRRRARSGALPEGQGSSGFIDDDVTCKTCGKRFEIPSHRALIFLEELEGLPQEDYDE